MKKTTYFFLLIALCFSQVLKAQDEVRPFVHCIVLDKTKSMIGRDGTKQGTTNIWNDVQNYCCGMIDGFMPSSTVLLYTFDKELFGPEVFEIKSEADKTTVKNKVRSVVPDGQYTWIASNLAKVIDAVYKRFKNHNIMIYLLTDGIEEQQECNIEEVIQTYEGYTGDYDHLYYVDLRGKLRDSSNPCAKEFQGVLESSGKGSIVDSLTVIVNLAPQYKTLYHQVAENEENKSKFTVTQIFEVTSGVQHLSKKLTKDLWFEAYIPEDSVKGVNFKIVPSKTFLGDMKPDEEKGKYRVEFEIENISNVSLFDCRIPVKLRGCSGDKTVTIEPSSFVIEITKLLPPKPVPPDIDGGWMVE